MCCLFFGIGKCNQSTQRSKNDICRGLLRQPSLPAACQLPWKVAAPDWYSPWWPRSHGWSLAFVVFSRDWTDNSINTPKKGRWWKIHLYNGNFTVQHVVTCCFVWGRHKLLICYVKGIVWIEIWLLPPSAPPANAPSDQGCSCVIRPPFLLPTKKRAKEDSAKICGLQESPERVGPKCGGGSEIRPTSWYGRYTIIYRFHTSQV